jgi:hypothetical protein
MAAIQTALRREPQPVCQGGRRSPLAGDEAPEPHANANPDSENDKSETSPSQPLRPCDGTSLKVVGPDIRSARPAVDNPKLGGQR